jgi:very-short-patch-repair endonuclease
MSQTTPEERTRLTCSAHDAIRGKPKNIDTLIKSAITREKMLIGSTQLEINFCNLLIAKGFSCIPQKAIGPYNIDIAILIPQIAIEIFGGNWHSFGRHAARYSKRIEYILDSGFTPVIIWNTARHPIGTGAMEYIISLSKELCSSPPIRSNEHMIGGDGYLFSVGNRKFNCFPGKRLTYYRDITTGCFNKAVWE